MIYSQIKVKKDYNLAQEVTSCFHESFEKGKSV